METENKNKSSLGCLSLILCVIAFGGIKTLVERVFKNSRQAVHQAHNERETATREGIEKAVRDLNLKMPLQIEEGLVCENAKPGSGNQIVYKYRLTKMRKADIDVRELKTVFGKELLDNYNTNPQVAGLKALGVSLKYEFFDADDILVATVYVPPFQ